LSGALTVGLGAFGAHALEDHFRGEGAALWETGARYQGWSALAVMLYGFLTNGASERGVRSWPGWSLLAGSLLFSVSLYFLAVGAPGWVGALTPFGGLAMICGWLGFAHQAMRSGHPKTIAPSSSSSSGL
jgi:uncharacterized membrane protein YgdD (TMEM256/DUF423 family)